MDLIRYAAKILAELMYFAYDFLCYPSWIAHNYMIYKDYVDSISLKPALERIQGDQVRENITATW